MSRPLSFTSMIMPEMMLKAATTMISVRIRNITLRSISTALKMLELALLPVEDAHVVAERGGDQLRHRGRPVGIGDDDLEVADRVGQMEEDLRRFERHDR